MHVAHSQVTKLLSYYKTYKYNVTLLYIVFKMAQPEPNSGVKGKGNITRIYQISLTVSQ